MVRERIFRKTGKHLQVKLTRSTLAKDKVFKFKQVYQGVRVYGKTLSITKSAKGLPDFSTARGFLLSNLEKDLKKRPSLEEVSEQVKAGMEKGEGMNELVREALKEETDLKDLNFTANGKMSKWRELTISLRDNHQAVWEVQFKILLVISFIEEGKKNRDCAMEFCIGWDVQKSKIARFYVCTETEDKSKVITLAGGNKGPLGLKRHKVTVSLDKLSINNKQVCMAENDYVRVVNLRFMEEDEDAMKVIVKLYKTRKGREVLKSKIPEVFSCDSEYLGDEENGGYSAIADALYYGEQVMRMLKDRYNMPQAFPSKMVLFVHGGKFKNAFFMDDFYDKTNNMPTTTYGDGGDESYPLITPGIVAHEFGHGLTQYSSNLEYRGQSGAINEAFSDMTAKAFEHYLASQEFEDTDKVGWKIGALIEKQEKEHGGFRDMAHPGVDNHSIESAANYSSGLDVHYTSGIFNKVFYLLSTTEGWDVMKAYEIFLEANTAYWNEESTFNSAACDVIAAAEDLCYNSEDVRNVFKQVDVDLHQTDCVKTLANNEAFSFSLTGNKPMYFLVRKVDGKSVNFFLDTYKGAAEMCVENGDASQKICSASEIEMSEGETTWYVTIRTPGIIQQVPRTVVRVRVVRTSRSQGCSSRYGGVLVRLFQEEPHPSPGGATFHKNENAQLYQAPGNPTTTTGRNNKHAVSKGAIRYSSKNTTPSWHELLTNTTDTNQEWPDQDDYGLYEEYHKSNTHSFVESMIRECRAGAT